MKKNGENQNILEKNNLNLEKMKKEKKMKLFYNLKICQVFQLNFGLTAIQVQNLKLMMKKLFHLQKIIYMRLKIFKKMV